MTVLVTDIVAGPFTLTGGTSVLPYTFLTITDPEIEVYRIVAGLEVPVSNLDFTVNRNRNPDGSHAEGGTVTITSLSGQAYLRANPYKTQEQIWTNQGSRLSNLNEALDRAALVRIRNAYDAARNGGGGSGGTVDAMARAMAETAQVAADNAKAALPGKAGVTGANLSPTDATAFRVKLGAPLASDVTAALLQKANAADVSTSVAALTAAIGTKISSSLIGAVNGVAPLGPDSKVPSAFLPINGSYKGTWNANTNSPTITSGMGINGDRYVVGTAGSTTIDGVSSWAVGDELIFNGTVWQKVPNTALVSSVAGKVGNVTLAVTDVANALKTDGSNLSSAQGFRAYLNVQDFRPEDYGGFGGASMTTGVGTLDTAAVQAALTAAKNAGGGDVVISRVHKVGDLTIADGVRLRGVGIGALVFAANSGLTVTGTSGITVGPFIDIRDLKFRTTNQSSKPVIRVNLTGGDGGTAVTGVVQNVDIRGINGACGFTYGIYGTNWRNVSFTNVCIEGDRDTAVPSVVSLGGIFLDGSDGPCEANFRNCEIYAVYSAWKFRGLFEGIEGTGNTCVSVMIGIDDDVAAGGGEPLIQWGYGHINVYGIGIKSRSRVQSMISNMDIYMFGTNSIGIQVDNDSGLDASFIIANNVFHNFSSGTIGVDVTGSGGGKDNVVIHDNIFDDGVGNIAIGIRVQSDADGVYVGPNTFRNVSVPLSNSGSNTFITHVLRHDGGSGVVIEPGPNGLPVSNLYTPSVLPDGNGTRASGSTAGRRWSAVATVNIDVSGGFFLGASQLFARATDGNTTYRIGEGFTRGTFRGNLDSDEPSMRNIGASGEIAGIFLTNAPVVSSDMTLKTDWGQPSSALLAEIRKLKAHHYVRHGDGMESYGYFAQEIIAAFEAAGEDALMTRVVQIGSDGKYKVDYTMVQVLKVAALEMFG